MKPKYIQTGLAEAQDFTLHKFATNDFQNRTSY